MKSAENGTPRRAGIILSYGFVARWKGSYSCDFLLASCLASKCSPANLLIYLLTGPYYYIKFFNKKKLLLRSYRTLGCNSIQQAGITRIRPKCCIGISIPFVGSILTAGPLPHPSLVAQNICRSSIKVSHVPFCNSIISGLSLYLKIKISVTSRIS